MLENEPTPVDYARSARSWMIGIGLAGVVLFGGALAASHTIIAINDRASAPWGLSDIYSLMRK